jgi:hypothetical protein
MLATGIVGLSNRRLGVRSVQLRKHSALRAAAAVGLDKLSTGVRQQKKAPTPSQRPRCRALNRTLTDFCVVSARPISNEYGPLQMGALAYRFTRQGFFRFSPRAGRPKERPRRGRGRGSVGVSLTAAGDDPT